MPVNQFIGSGYNCSSFKKGMEGSDYRQRFLTIVENGKDGQPKTLQQLRGDIPHMSANRILVDMSKTAPPKARNTNSVRGGKLWTITPAAIALAAKLTQATNA